ncbi:MAG TPA: PadR family transcriptional regulator [Solirubrobacterales bacterium]|jgi:DNA-binding PadR family transcriptional regulator|nr:PadR family transcriptional regulator [Solirubrobacterales bacterium]
MSRVKLTDTSYAVLGLIDQWGPSNPYQLKSVASVSVFHFWTIPHTQIYTECRKLAEAGLLDEQREETGRRRRTYRLTAKGRKALAEWRTDPNTDYYELRDPGLMKLFAGADPAALAETQLEAHERRLHSYEALHDTMPDMPEGMRLALEAGIGHAREYVRFWSGLRKGRGNR